MFKSGDDKKKPARLWSNEKTLCQNMSHYSTFEDDLNFLRFNPNLSFPHGAVLTPALSPETMKSSNL